MDNLTAQIAEYQTLLARDAEAVDARTKLVELLLSRTQFFGSYADFDRADELSATGIALNPNSAEAHQSRAVFLGAVHRFVEARAELDLAERFGSKAAVAQRATLDLATASELEAVLMMRSAAAAQHPSFATLADRAAAEAALGRFETADRSYLEALSLYRDVSPFPVAWVSFQRGVMWAETADRPDLAVPLYGAALATLPHYVVANVHLAELEAADGDRDAAIARLESIRISTNDPEPNAVLAKLLMENAPELAAERAEEARSGYDALLLRHPAAFRDHAAEFFSNAGNDPARAVRLALENLAERPTPRAYIVGLNAASAAGDESLVCRLARDAESLAVYNRNLLNQVEAAAFDCKAR